MNDIFLELSLVIGVSTLAAIIMRLLKQPLIIGYIISGIVVGPTVLDLVQSEDTIEAFASFGIALLLFIIGLGLNPKIVKEVGKAAFFTGFGQVAFTTLFGFGLVTLLGYSGKAAIYGAVALAFSSTIVVLKLLSDKKEQNRLYARVAVGFLLVQDILAALALVVASASASGSLSFSEIGILLAKGLYLLLTLFMMARYVLPHIKIIISGSQELLFIFAIAWGFGVASIFREAGFSLEVGALAAGVALATQSYALEIGSRLRPLRDFFVIMFFVALGTHVKLGSSIELLPEALLLSTFVLIGNPIIVMSILGRLGYTKKTSFKAGLAVAQISEFSLVFILLGSRLGQIDSEFVGLITLVGLITIAVSSYMIIYADALYDKLKKPLSIFERKDVKPDKETSSNPRLFLIGHKKGGDQFISVFKDMKKKYLVLDYDPSVIEKLEQDNVPNVYGDVTDLELLEEIQIDKAQLVVSTMTDFAANAFLAGYMNNVSPKTVVICSADTPGQAADLYAEGVDYVMMPHYIGSEKIVSFIKRSGLKRDAYQNFKSKHILRLSSDHTEHYTDTKKKRIFGSTALSATTPEQPKKASSKNSTKKKSPSKKSKSTPKK